jgi:hypothetical protein
MCQISQAPLYIEFEIDLKLGGSGEGLKLPGESGKIFLTRVL